MAKPVHQKGVSAFFQVLSCLLIKPIKTTWYSGLTKTSTSLPRLSSKRTIL
ncbi:hypothetical protein M5Y21_03180 [Neisseria meningitidis]|nr:hypothetical protein [Neisseria meningitidis]